MSWTKTIRMRHLTHLWLAVESRYYIPLGHSSRLVREDREGKVRPSSLDGEIFCPNKDQQNLS